MSSLLLLFLLQHGIVSARAGLITFQKGGTTVERIQHLPVDKPIRTYRFAKIEAMLNPGSYLRVDQNSEFALECADLDQITIRLISGRAVIEAVGIQKKNAIAVRAAAHELRIVKPGVYSFSDGVAAVRDGRLEIADSAVVVEKGWQLNWTNAGLEKTRIRSDELHPIEKWSRQRSLELNPPTKVRPRTSRGGTIVYSGRKNYGFSRLRIAG